MAVSEKVIESVAKKIRDNKKNIILIYAFNGTGKTRLSLMYKDLIEENVDYNGVYYNAYSEDLFQWDNEDVALKLVYIPERLKNYFSDFDESKVKPFLQNYSFDFQFQFNTEENGKLNSIVFFTQNDINKLNPIKISRGEERIFTWCFFLALFSKALTEEQNKYFFIDDPVSSLDENNIFITTSTIIDIIERYSQDRKIIIATHHIGFFTMLINWLEYEKDDNKKNFIYRNKYKTYLLKRYPIVEGNITNNIEQDILKEYIELKDFTNQLFLYHLVIINEIDNAINNSMLQGYHVVLLRQLLEYISSFIGYGNFSEVLKKIGFTDNDANNYATLINFLSHKNLYTLHSNLLDDGQVTIFKDIFERTKTKYEFNIKKDNKTDSNTLNNIEIHNQNEGCIEDEQNK